MPVPADVSTSGTEGVLLRVSDCFIKKPADKRDRKTIHSLKHRAGDLGEPVLLRILAVGDSIPGDATKQGHDDSGRYSDRESRPRRATPTTVLGLPGPLGER